MLTPPRKSKGKWWEDMEPNEDDEVVLSEVPMPKTCARSQDDVESTVSQSASDSDSEDASNDSNGAPEAIQAEDDDEIDESLPILSEDEKLAQWKTRYQLARERHIAQMLSVVQDYWQGVAKDLNTKSAPLLNVSLNEYF